MEKTIANNILTGMQILQQVQVQSKIPNTNANETTNNTKEASHSLSSKESWIRAIKIGSVGAVAGTLFAVTGGWAAPGIAAGISAFGGMSLVGSSAAAAATAITATPHALMLFFGLGGGGLSAYKMKKRTDGLSEFRIRQEIPDEDTKQETNDNKQESNGSDDTTAQSPDIGQNRNELHSTICVAGWLGDKCDFQRPFGVNLTDPSPSNIEQLERFFSVYDPERIPECQQLLSFYEDQQAVLWEELKKQYGCDPDHLYPIVTHNNKNEDGTMRGLKEEEDQILEEIFHCILCSHSNADDLKSHIAKMKATKSKDLSESLVTTSAEQLGSTQSHSFPKRGYISSKKKESFGKDLYSLLSLNYHVVKVKSPQASSPSQQQYVWDYQGVYGGNLFTVTWESDMLLNVCDVVNNLVKEIANQATEKVLQKTALAALLSAVSWPSTILSMADMIDEEWSMVCLRADMAGVELAKSLLESTELQPVTFVGFSFGARVIYSCLLELARHQDIWEQQQHNQSSLGCNTTDNTFAPDKDKGSKTSSSDVLIYRREPASIVESVVLMGMPVHSDKKAWRLIRSVVAGRLINCFSRKDWILSLMFRWKSIRVWGNPCGITMIDLPGVENHDVSSLVTTHADYCFAVYSILEMVGFHQPA